MAGKQQIIGYVAGCLGPFLEENGLSLYHVDFARQGRDWNLDVTIDRLPGPDGEEQYVGSDDCEKVSRYLSDCLDRDDPIPQNYLLTVSSPGLDRVLYEPEDFRRFLGRLVDIRLYSGVEKRKEFTGELLSCSEDGKIGIREEDGTEWIFDRKQVAKASLAIVF